MRRVPCAASVAGDIATSKYRPTFLRVSGRAKLGDFVTFSGWNVFILVPLVAGIFDGSEGFRHRESGLRAGGASRGSYRIA
jgi:hypothetical protein